MDEYIDPGQLFLKQPAVSAMAEAANNAAAANHPAQNSGHGQYQHYPAQDLSSHTHDSAGTFHVVDDYAQQYSSSPNMQHNEIRQSSFPHNGFTGSQNLQNARSGSNSGYELSQQQIQGPGHMQLHNQFQTSPAFSRMPATMHQPDPHIVYRQPSAVSHGYVNGMTQHEFARLPPDQQQYVLSHLALLRQGLVVNNHIDYTPDHKHLQPVVGHKRQFDEVTQPDNNESYGESYGSSQQEIEIASPKRAKTQEDDNSFVQVVQHQRSPEQDEVEPEQMQYVSPQQLLISPKLEEEKSESTATMIAHEDEATCTPKVEPDVIHQPPEPVVISSSDDEPKITKVVQKVSPEVLKEESRMVCIGRLNPCKALAFRVPNPGFRPANLTHWPRFKVKVRDNQHGSKLIFTLSDPAGNDFANLDPQTARILRQAIDTSKSTIILNKLEVFLKRRIMYPGEAAGDQFPEGVECHLAIDLTLNVPKKVATKMVDYTHRFNFTLTANGLFDMHEKEEAEHDHDIQLWMPRLRDEQAASADEAAVERAAMTMINLHTSVGLKRISQPSSIVTPLLAHQEEALYFMIEREKNPFTTQVDENFMIWKPEMKDGAPAFYNKAVHEHVHKMPDPALGGILADDMGLGKTLSLLSLIAATLPQANAFAQRKPILTRNGQPKPNLKATLIVVPTSLLDANWLKQIALHLGKNQVEVVRFYGPDRARDISAFKNADIVLTTYGVLESDARTRSIRGGPLLPRANWFRIVLDEAHMIRNSSTCKARACCAIESSRRWCITGTPIQNHISDLGSLCIFLRLTPFHTMPLFRQYIQIPFQEGKTVVLSRLRVLVDTMTLRRTKDNLGLPEKEDGTISIDMSPKEKQLYNVLAENTFKQIKAMTHNRTKMAAGTMGHFLKKLSIIRQFCAHKQDMLSQEDLKLLQGFTADAPIEIEDEEESDLEVKVALDMLAILKECNSSTCDLCKDKLHLPTEAMDVESSETPPPDGVVCYMNACYHLICPKCVHPFMKEQEANQSRFDPNSYTCKICDRVVRMAVVELSYGIVEDFFRKREELRAKPRLAKKLGTYTGPSSKVLYLLNNCKNFMIWNAAHAEEMPMKAVVFSYWTTHLDLIEIALEDHNIKYCRLDGRMGQKQRLEAINQFEQDNDTIIFLVSIGAGGVGLNLVAANVVFLMEPQWNPQAEQQAVDRVHRIGQKRSVRVARLIAKDTIEEKIQEIGQRKLELARITLTKKLGAKEERQRKMLELQSLFSRRR